MKKSDVRKRREKTRKILRETSISHKQELLPGLSPFVRLVSGFVFGILGAMAEAQEQAAPPVAEIDNIEEMIEDKDNPGTFISKQ